MTLFDTADICGLDGGAFGDAEALLGRKFAEAPALRGHGARDQGAVSLRPRLTTPGAAI
ncbi:hypothetical protein [Sphingomonas bacterium]|uniref:hypothetical protein n=1 Tax=Sphingomonas bacterium TaxID=1895847 RepID=UPI0020C6503C|nr:hypothetical protein [Sphingomonas bacterium]